MKDYVTYREALDALGVSDRTLRRYLARLELVPHRASNGRVFLGRDQLTAVARAIGLPWADQLGRGDTD